MQNIDIDIDISGMGGMPIDVITKIEHAINNNLPFGLISKKGRHMMVFAPSLLTSWWVPKEGAVNDGMTYADVTGFMNGIKLAMVSCREFVELNNENLPPVIAGLLANRKTF